MYTFNMLDYAEMYRDERMREAAYARLRAKVVAGRTTNMLVMLGEVLTGLGAVLTALGAYLTSQRSV